MSIPNGSPQDGEKLLLKLSKAAQLLSMSERKLWSLAISGNVPSFKVGNSRFFSIEALREWIQEQSNES